MRRRGRVRRDAARGRHRVSGHRGGIRHPDATRPQPLVDRFGNGRTDHPRRRTIRRIGAVADAKGLMALTLLVPTYPNASPFPVYTADPRVQPAFQALFPSSFVVLVDAAVLQLAVPVGLFLYNLTRGDVGIQSFLGYRAPLDPLPKHVRLMERITDRGEHVVVLRPKRDLDPTPEILKLRSAG